MHRVGAGLSAQRRPRAGCSDSSRSKAPGQSATASSASRTCGASRVGFRVDGDRDDAHRAAGANHTASDLAAIGDQHAPNHRGGVSSRLGFADPALPPLAHDACAFRETRGALPGLQVRRAGWRSPRPSATARRREAGHARCSAAPSSPRSRTAPLSGRAATCRSTARSSRSAVTTSWTRPISLARAAENRVPLRQSSRAADRPILRTTNGEIMPGRIPSTTSVNPKTASSAATTTSQTAARPGAAAECGAVDAADHGHGDRIDRVEHPRGPSRVGEVLLAGIAEHFRHPLDVGASREHRSGALKHDHADRSVGGHGRRPAGQFLDQPFVERIPDVRAIERDRRDRSGRDEEVGHDAYMRKMPKRASGIGALYDAEMPSANASRVRAGSSMPSSQSRAVE